MVKAAVVVQMTNDSEGESVLARTCIAGRRDTASKSRLVVRRIAGTHVGEGFVTRSLDRSDRQFWRGSRERLAVVMCDFDVPVAQKPSLSVRVTTSSPAPSRRVADWELDASTSPTCSQCLVTP